MEKEYNEYITYTVTDKNGAVAEDPCIADIGILVSTDPIAIDQACIDLVYGTREYELIEV